LIEVMSINYVVLSRKNIPLTESITNVSSQKYVCGTQRDVASVIIQ